MWGGTYFTGSQDIYQGIPSWIPFTGSQEVFHRIPFTGSQEVFHRIPFTGSQEVFHRIPLRKHSVPGLPRLTNRSWGLLVGLEHTPCQASPGPWAGGGLAQSVF